MAITVKIDPGNYNPVYYKYLDANQRIQILFGGSSSGKSVFAAQRVVYDLLKGGRNYLCCRKVQNTIRKSVFLEVKKIVSRYGLSDLFQINKSELTITCRNGYQAVFAGLDDPEKIKSITAEKGPLTDIWVEEATETADDDIRQLTKRLRGETGGVQKRILLTFNPILKTHWIFQLFFGAWQDDQRIHDTDDLLILKTTYKDNQFLEPDDIKALEDETDEYFYQVYTLGNWGVLGDLVFKNWCIQDVINSDRFETFDIFRNGLDFGFSNDPTAFCRVYYHSATKTLYIVDEWHTKEVTNPEIAQELKPRLKGDYVICDSSEPKSIVELGNHGISAIGAKKGKDSVLHGIQWLKQQRIIIDKRCQHTINEFQQYHWEKNKDGEALNKPVDRFNHHIDAIRYACEELMLQPEGMEIFSADSTAASADWEF